MAQVIWQKRAENELYRYLVNGFLEFGETTANKFSAKVAHINDDLAKYPETGFPEPLLKDRKKIVPCASYCGSIQIDILLC